jgi:hypothetical protein
MCWSFEVAASASAAEAAVLAFCWWRQSKHDRRHVMGHLPILAQEVCQAVLWKLMAPEDTTATCSRGNRAVSFVVVIVVHALPLMFATKARLGLIHNPGLQTVRGGPGFINRLFRTQSRALLWAVFLPLLTGGLMLGGV